MICKLTKNENKYRIILIIDGLSDKTTCNYFYNKSTYASPISDRKELKTSWTDFEQIPTLTHKSAFNSNTPEHYLVPKIN